MNLTKPIRPTTLYYCRVKQVLRHTSDIPEHIYVQLFNGTVRIGEDYVLLLSDVGKTNPVFSLSRAVIASILSGSAIDPGLTGTLYRLVFEIRDHFEDEEEGDDDSWIFYLSKY